MKLNHDISPADQAYITDCLGREATQLIAIPARDAAGQPAVITCHPLKGLGESLTPFPTMYWLIDPQRCRAVADLERRGVIGELEEQIAQDAALREAVAQDHCDYAAQRWAILTTDEQQQAIEAGLAGTLRDKGIGGIADFTKIKCLHLHMAHHLTQPEGTAVGRMIEAASS